MRSPRDELVIANVLLLGGVFERNILGTTTVRHPGGWSTGYFRSEIDAAWSFANHCGFKVLPDGSLVKAPWGAHNTIGP